jgi:hypothetical protein
MNRENLADSSHPRVNLIKEQADLLLILVKVDFALRISAAVKAGGARKDPAAVMEAFSISDNLELVIATTYLLLNVSAGVIGSVPCPSSLRTYLEGLLEGVTVNSPEAMESNDDSRRLYQMLLEHKGPILEALNRPVQGFTQFSLKGPARA